MKLNNQDKQGYKNTPFGWIPEEWKIKKLGDITLIKGEYGINAAAVDYDDLLPAYIRITDIDDDGYFSTNKKKSVNDINSNNFYLVKDDLVFVRTGATVGKAYLYNEKDGKLVFAGFLIRFRIDTSKANPYFLWNYTKSKHYWDWVNTVSMRSGQPGINSTEYSSFQFPLPPLPEQHRIATILSTWDEAITKTQQLIAQLQQRNNGLMQQLLAPSRNWKEFKIGDLLKEVKRPVKWDDSELYNLISVRRRSGGAFFRESLLGNQILTKQLFIAQDNDFLISKMQIVHGASAVVPTHLAGMKISGSYIAIHAKDEKILNIHFFNWLSKTPWFCRLTYISSYGVHIEKMTFDYNDFKRRSIMLPAINDQQRIVNILQKAVEEVKLYEQQLTTLQQQKKGLMQKLLTGEIRVKVN